MAEQVQSISVAAIAPSPFNPRREFNKEALGELTDSIRVLGVQVALIVRPAGKGYELIAGERRWRAAKIAGLAEVPAVVRALDDAAARAVQIVENLQRQDLAPLEEAQGFRDYLDNGGEIKALAAAVGKSPRYIYARMQMLTLAPAALKELAEGKISPGHASELAALPAPLQQEVLDEIDQQQDYGDPMSVQDVRKHIAEHYRLNLDAAPWPKDDPRLNAIILGKKTRRGGDQWPVGSCTSCPKRAGSNPDKFAGLKPNTCTDPICFRAKAAAFVELRREKNPDLLLVAFPDNGASQQDFEALPYGKDELVASYGYTRNAKCDAAQTALIVASRDAEQIGRAIEICRDRKCRTHHTPEISGGSGSRWSAAQKRQEKRRRAELDRRGRLFRALVEKNASPSIDEQRAALAWAIERIDHDHAKRACEGLGIPPAKAKYGGQDYQGALRKRAAGVNPKHLTAWFVYAAIAAEDLFYGAYLSGPPKTDLLDQVAKRLRVKTPPAPAKKPAAPTSAKPGTGSAEKRRNVERPKRRPTVRKAIARVKLATAARRRGRR